MEHFNCNEHSKMRPAKEKSELSAAQMREKKAVEGIIEVLHANGITAEEGEALLSFCAVAFPQSIMDKRNSETGETSAKSENPAKSENLTKPETHATQEKDFSHLETPEVKQEPLNEITIDYLKARLMAAMSKSWDEWWAEIRKTANDLQRSSKYPYR